MGEDPGWLRHRRTTQRNPVHQLQRSGALTLRIHAAPSPGPVRPGGHMEHGCGMFSCSSPCSPIITVGKRATGTLCHLTFIYSFHKQWVL